MRSVMGSIRSISSGSPLTGLRRSEARRPIPIHMAMRPPSSECIAGTGLTMKWINAQLPALTKPLPMSDWIRTALCGRYCTTTLPGQPQLRWPATIVRLIMCRAASAFRAGHGMDWKSKSPAGDLSLRSFIAQVRAKHAFNPVPTHSPTPQQTPFPYPSSSPSPCRAVRRSQCR